MKANNVCCFQGLFTVSIATFNYIHVYKLLMGFYFSELLQLVKFVSLFIYFMGNFRRYKNLLYGIYTHTYRHRHAHTQCTSARLWTSPHFNCIFFSLTSLALSYCSLVVLSITSNAVLMASSNLEVCPRHHMIHSTA